MLRARFEDAQFFYRADLATPLEALRPRLAGTLFHKDLGTLLDKAGRVEALIAPLAAAAGLAGARPPGRPGADAETPHRFCGASQTPREGHCSRKLYALLLRRRQSARLRNPFRDPSSLESRPAGLQMPRRRRRRRRGWRARTWRARW